MPFPRPASFPAPRFYPGPSESGLQITARGLSDPTQKSGDNNPGAAILRAAYPRTYPSEALYPGEELVPV